MTREEQNQAVFANYRRALARLDAVQSDGNAWDIDDAERALTAAEEELAEVEDIIGRENSPFI